MLFGLKLFAVLTNKQVIKNWYNIINIRGAKRSSNYFDLKMCKNTDPLWSYVVTAGAFQGMNMTVVSYLKSLSFALKIISLTVLSHPESSLCDEMLCNDFSKRTMLFGCDRAKHFPCNSTVHLK